MYRFCWIFLSLFINSTQQAFAADLSYPTDSDLKSLPPYCSTLLRKVTEHDPEYLAWREKLGEGFGSSHHYCQSLNLINRYYRERDPNERRYILQASLGEFAYVIEHAPQTYVLMPEILMNRGWALAKLHKDGEAITDLMKSLELNPRLPRTYSVIADFYEERKIPGKAIETISEGLKHIPNNKSLQHRYVKLGGKMPFPEPYEQAPADAQPSAKKTEDGALAQPKETSGKTDKNVPEPIKSDSLNKENPPTQIGVPGNPYCRFCPDPAPAPADTPAAPPATPK
jgi:tetratricopeptide (TPR) repeat protein